MLTKNPGQLGRPVLNKIGQGLREYFDASAAEALPETMQAQLARLDEKVQCTTKS